MNKNGISFVLAGVLQFIIKKMERGNVQNIKRRFYRICIEAKDLVML